MPVLVSIAVLCGPVSSSLAQSPTSQGGSDLLRDAIARAKGEKPKPEKVFYGDDANWQDHKWQVGIFSADDPKRLSAQFCSGSLISSRWVVTAAHCVDKDIKPKQIDILSGTADLRPAASDGKRTAVSKIYVHRAYGIKISNDSDIALVELNEDAIGEPIPLVESLEMENNIAAPKQNATISGWGRIETGKFTEVLKAGAIPIVSAAKCNGLLSWNGRISDNMICAGLDTAGTRGCNGDSGGPLTITGRLIGVVSWGPTKCDSPRLYTVFTRVVQFHDDILTCLNGTDGCKDKWKITE